MYIYNFKISHVNALVLTGYRIYEHSHVLTICYYGEQFIYTITLIEHTAYSH